MMNMGQIIGYARVSSVGQSLDVQIDKLSIANCDRIFSDKLSGVTDDRPELKQCLDYVREGDRLIITKLDRLARSTLHLAKIADVLEQKGVELVVLDQSIDTGTPTGRLMFTMLGAIAEFENEIRKERQQDGITMALSKGVKFGRKPALSDKQIEALKADRESGLLIRDLMLKYNLKKTTVYKYLGSFS
jgi:DNA invertase Pin-like site-specific DNA recombinase